jgi:hypothetical protein
MIKSAIEKILTLTDIKTLKNLYETEHTSKGVHTSPLHMMPKNTLTVITSTSKVS